MTDAFFPATAMPDEDWWHALWPDPEATLRALGLKEGMSALDLCCGDGYFTAPMARIAGGAVWGVDIDPEMLGRTRDALDAAGAQSLGLMLADARDLARMGTGKVDFLLIANTFHGVPDQTALARAAEATLAPGGRFVVVNWHARPREETPVLGAPRGPATDLRMTPEGTARAIAPAGLTLERVVDLPPYHYGAIFVTEDG